MQRKKHNVRIALPGYVFGPAWLLLYGVIIASGYIFFREYAEDNPYYLTTCILYLANILLNKLWPLAFFSLTRNGRRYALLILIVLLLTGAAVVALQLLSGATLAGVLYGIYLGWLLYALLLNVKWLWVPPCLRSAHEQVPDGASRLQQQHPGQEDLLRGRAKYRSANAPARTQHPQAPQASPAGSPGKTSKKKKKQRPGESGAGNGSNSKGNIPRFNIRLNKT